MNIWWIIALTGIGTFLMRSAGVWVKPEFVQGRWLNHLPFAVILVIAISSLSGFTTTEQETIRTILASAAVIAASLRQLPLVVCIAIGCGVFGVLSSL
jgi:branched-subunit amino acid transport protein AzlD